MEEMLKKLRSTNHCPVGPCVLCKHYILNEVPRKLGESEETEHRFSRQVQRVREQGLSWKDLSGVCAVDPQPLKTPSSHGCGRFLFNADPEELQRIAKEAIEGSQWEQRANYIADKFEQQSAEVQRLKDQLKAKKEDNRKLKEEAERYKSRLLGIETPVIKRNLTMAEAFNNRTLTFLGSKIVNHIKYHHDCDTLEDLSKLSLHDVRETPEMGKKSVSLIKEVLQENGYQLAGKRF
jgi:hypothetical protein